jgi:hypothetical protein
MNKHTLRLLLLIPFIGVAFLLVATYSGHLKLGEAIGPCFTLLSIGAAALVASESITSSRRLQTQKLTIELLENDYPIRNSHYAEAVKKITDGLASTGKIYHELQFEDLDAIVRSLSKDEHSKVKELLNYYSTIARGVVFGYIDEELALSSLSGAHITVWMECWPVILWHQRLDERQALAFRIGTTRGFTRMYSYLEKWMTSLVGKESIYPPASSLATKSTSRISENTN